MSHVWKVASSINGSTFLDIGCYAVLILNQPISIPQKYVIDLWNRASFRATADGGTDRWYDFVSSLTKKSQLMYENPDLASGDFDSVRPETLQKCKDSGVPVVHTPDQDKTDFTKALEEIVKHTNGKLDSVVAVVENSGRLDHIMSNLNTLYSSPVRLFLLASESLTWLLSAGSHTIHVPLSLVKAEATCGLIPLGAPCVASSTGLKWDLDKTEMKFGGLISTCNSYSQDCGGVVTVDTDSPLLWTMNLRLDGTSS